MAVTSAGALEVLDTRRWYTQKWGGELQHNPVNDSIM